MGNLLVEVTINGDLHRVSNEQVALTNAWSPKIISMASPQYKTASKFGGYVYLAFGGITFFPDLFTSNLNNWPPPVECPITVKYTSSTQELAETLFEGTCYMKEMTRSSVRYNLYAPSYEETIADATALNGTLASYAETWAGDLGLTYEGNRARDPSPAVVYTVSGEQRKINVLSQICSFFSHFFYIKNGILHLCDMLVDNNSRTITEFNFFPSEYKWDEPVSTIYSGDYQVDNIFPYGTSMTLTAYHDTQSNIEDALWDITGIVNQSRCTLKLPLQGNLPLPGERISWTDTSLASDLDAYIRGRTIQYNFDKEEIRIEGEGVLTQG
jgi:hypothetical protein